MIDKHFSSQFDADLKSLCAQMLEMGRLVETQAADAMDALNHLDAPAVQRVISNEQRVNALEIEIDQECSNVIVRRQPAARDLRLLMAISKIITNLERAGDEAVKIAVCTQRLQQTHTQRHMIHYAELEQAGAMGVSMLHRALESFVHLDTAAAAQVVRDDCVINDAFRAFVRTLITSMKEDVHMISTGLDCLSVAKAIERIGDHATNLAEFTIYIAKGTDVRHISPEQLEREALR